MAQPNGAVPPPHESAPRQPSSSQRWLRLNLEWQLSGWLDALDGHAANCWPPLLCWIKLHGRDGRCRRPPLPLLARSWKVDVADIERLETAALQDGALVLEGADWVLANWAKYNPPDPSIERRRRRKQLARSATEENPKDVLGVSGDSPGVSGGGPAGLRRATVDKQRTDDPLSSSWTTEGAAGFPQPGPAPPAPGERKASGPDPGGAAVSAEGQNTAAAVLRFAQQIGTKGWRLKRSVVEWTVALLADARYRGLDIPYEIAKCHEWHESKGKHVGAPTLALLNWLGRAAEDVHSGRRIAAGSEAARVRAQPAAEMPQESGRRSTDGRGRIHAERRQLAAEEVIAARVDAWSRAHEADAAALWVEARASPRVVGTLSVARERMAKIIYRRLVLARLEGEESHIGHPGGNGHAGGVSAGHVAPLRVGGASGGVPGE
jgi:hypothetical protein